MTVHRISFCSSIVHCDELRRCVQAVGKTEGYSEAFLSRLELTVQEAFVNAVRHGNGSNSELPVSIVLRDGRGDSGRFLEVEVRDCGKGFVTGVRHDLDKVADPESFSGRGIPFIAHYVDSLNIDSRTDGSVLIMRYIPF
jgi:serine/threonine-protein kinase RsbW